jgi:hypothetical protein
MGGMTGDGDRVTLCWRPGTRLGAEAGTVHLLHPLTILGFLPIRSLGQLGVAPSEETIDVTVFRPSPETSDSWRIDTPAL